MVIGRVQSRSSQRLFLPRSTPARSHLLPLWTLHPGPPASAPSSSDVVYSNPLSSRPEEDARSYMHAVLKMRFAARRLTAFAVPASPQAAVSSPSERSTLWPNSGYTLYNRPQGRGTGRHEVWTETGAAREDEAGDFDCDELRSRLDHAKSINESISYYIGWGRWRHSVPRGTITWDCAFDIWVPTEVMVWVGKSSGVGPQGSLQYSHLPIGGHSWNVYGENRSFNVISFVRTSDSFSGSVTIRGLPDCARVVRPWISNGTIAGLGVGFEIFRTGDAGSNYTMKDLSMAN